MTTEEEKKEKEGDGEVKADEKKEDDKKEEDKKEDVTMTDADKKEEGDEKKDDGKKEDEKKDDEKKEDEKKDEPMEDAGKKEEEGEKKEEEKKEEGDKKEEKKNELTKEETIAKVSERLEFFFSNANLRKDSFMQKQMLDDDKKVYSKGVDVNLLMKFNSIKQISQDVSLVLEAAKTLDDLCVVDEKISRKSPMTVDQLDDNIPLSLMVENLKVDSESQRHCDKVQDVKDLFQSYGKVTLVKFRTYRQDHGKRYIAQGKCLVEFSTVEELEAAAGELAKSTKDEEDKKEPQKTLTLSGNKLVIYRLKDWIDMVKAKKKERQGQDDEEGEVKEDEDAKKITYEKGCVIQFKGVGSDCDREAISAAVQEGIKKLGNETLIINKDTVYINFARGQEDGAVRFKEPQKEIPELAKLLDSGDLKIANHAVKSCIVLSGEEEEKYWTDFITSKNNNNKKRNHPGGGGGRGKRKKRKSN